MNDFTEPNKVASLLENLRCRWGVAGGWALDLFLNRVTRKHQDIEVAISREDQLILREYLSTRGRSFEYVRVGKLFPWPAGESLVLPVHEIWCRIPTEPIQRLEVLLNERRENEFVFRRDSRVVAPIDCAFVRSKCSIPILAPEVVLLYKAKQASEAKEQFDFSNMLDALGAERRRWLFESIAVVHPGHEWLGPLRRSHSA